MIPSAPARESTLVLIPEVDPDPDPSPGGLIVLRAGSTTVTEPREDVATELGERH